MPTAPAEALIDRFLADCQVAGPVKRQDRIGLAVSGGPDSLALLLLADAAFRGQISVATVDHRLRPESTTEAQFVASVCADLGVAHNTLEFPRSARRVTSATARDLRYALLRQWYDDERLDWLMTGHHADDQLETMIMRLNRGVGIGGLAGVRRKNNLAMRPLLGWRRHDLVALVHAAGLCAVDDPTNRDNRYDRARLRKSLKDAEWLDPIAWNRTAVALDEANAALRWAAVTVANTRVKADGDVLRFDASNVPPELKRRILALCIWKLTGGEPTDGKSLTRMLATLDNAGVGTLAKVACDARGDTWTFALAPPRRAVAPKTPTD